jgi:hypothetical protein
MRIIVVGLGVQGNKRFEHAKDSVVAIVDPINLKADYKNLQEPQMSISMN